MKKPIIAITAGALGLAALGALTFTALWAFESEGRPPEGAMAESELVARAQAEVEGEVDGLYYESEDGENLVYVEIEPAEGEDMYVVLDSVTGAFIEKMSEEEAEEWEELAELHELMHAHDEAHGYGCDDEDYEDDDDYDMKG